MNSQTDKAKKILPLSIDTSRPWRILDYEGFMITDLESTRLNFMEDAEFAAKIVQAVNQFDALTAVADAASVIDNKLSKNVTAEEWVKLHRAITELDRVRKGEAIEAQAAPDNLPAILLAIEFGHRGCEKGQNLQATIQQFQKL